MDQPRIVWFMLYSPTYSNHPSPNPTKFPEALCVSAIGNFQSLCAITHREFLGYAGDIPKLVKVFDVALCCLQPLGVARFVVAG